MKPVLLFVQSLFVAAQLREPGGRLSLCAYRIRSALFQPLIYHISKVDFEHQESDS